MPGGLLGRVEIGAAWGHAQKLMRWYTRRRSLCRPPAGQTESALIRNVIALPTPLFSWVCLFGGSTAAKPPLAGVLSVLFP
jgi:hypothetical protein